jgi:hypothetical protein
LDCARQRLDPILTATGRIQRRMGRLQLLFGSQSCRSRIVLRHSWRSKGQG